jgi:hypothetical protein
MGGLGDEIVGQNNLSPSIKLFNPQRRSQGRVAILISRSHPIILSVGIMLLEVVLHIVNYKAYLPGRLANSKPD